VAPLLMELKKRLDQSKNPFFKHAQASAEGRQTPTYAAQCGSVRVDARQCSPSSWVSRKVVADDG
jgi:hypothetical protein